MNCCEAITATAIPELRSRVFRGRFAAALVALSLTGAVATAQPVSRTIPTSPVCSRCTLLFDHLLDIGDADGPGIVESERSQVVVDSRGRFFLFQRYGASLKVFDQRGRYLSTIGRKGGGPGEFEEIAVVRITRGDSIHVLDNKLSRVSVFGPDLSFVRSAPLALRPQTQAVVLDDGRMVLALDARGRSQIGFPLHLLDISGRTVRSFGSETGLFRPDIPELVLRVIGRHREADHLWAAHEGAYNVERWDSRTFAMTERLTRQVSWFPNRERPQQRPWNPATDPPQTRIASVYHDASDRLWVGVSIADRRWRTAIRAVAQDHAEIVDLTRYTDAVIDVIDLRDGMLIASMRLDSVPGYRIADSLFAGTPREANGGYAVPIYRVRLAGLPGERR